MCRFVSNGRHLANLVGEAAAVCRAADAVRSCRGPGRPETYQQWQIAVLIIIAVAHRCKSKSSQHRFLSQHATPLQTLLEGVIGLKQLPSRATYMRRYRQVYELFGEAIRIGGRRALQEHVADASVMAVDKSMIPARGLRPPRRKHDTWVGVDRDAGFGKSAYDGWVWGHSYEVAVSIGPRGVIVPLLASADRANCNECRSCPAKIPLLPPSCRYLLADSGYDSNELGEAVEYDSRGRRTGRRFLCPLQHRGGKPCVGQQRRKGTRERRRRHRALRERFFHSVRGRRLFPLRKKTVEPFNQWFKHVFELEDHVWHRGLGDNRTMLLAAVFCYQLLQRYNHSLGGRDARVKRLLDML
jgi:hypothetical protein